MMRLLDPGKEKIRGKPFTGWFKRRGVKDNVESFSYAREIVRLFSSLKEESDEKKLRILRLV